jgi:uncharacterized protein YaeQ
MALKATIYKAQLQLADMDRHVYGDHALTIALHPSETEERMMMRVLAYALRVPGDDFQGRLEFAKGLSDTEEPDLWQKDLTGELVQWVEVGLPDDRRMLKVAPRTQRGMFVLAYGSSVDVWWSGIAGKVARARNLEVWRVPTEQSRALGAMAQRSMQIGITIQDRSALVVVGNETVQIDLEALR